MYEERKCIVKISIMQDGKGRESDDLRCAGYFALPHLMKGKHPYDGSYAESGSTPYALNEGCRLKSRIARGMEPNLLTACDERWRARHDVFVQVLCHCVWA